MISFSAALSGTHEMLEQARIQLLEKYPARTFQVVNTLGISMGAGILVYYAAQMWKDGKSMEEIIAWVTDNRQNMQHWFTVDDLHHLKRGGRISGTAATVGTLLEIKPLLTVNSEGRLVVVEKAKGRKRAIKAMVEHFFESAVEPETHFISVLHADALEDAEYMVSLLHEKYTLPQLRIDYVGPVIGTHCGPGTLALCFLGKERIK